MNTIVMLSSNTSSGLFAVMILISSYRSLGVIDAPPSVSARQASRRALSVALARSRSGVDTSAVITAK
jgi:hypothetical protein